MGQAPARLLMVVNVAWFFRSHRLPIAVAAKAAGYEVHVACRAEDLDAVRAIEDAGIILHDVPFTRSGANPARELWTLFALARVYRSVKPALAHHVTIKPVLYGSLLASLLRVPATVNALSGLGHVFSATGFIARARRFVVRGLYKLALNVKNSKVIVQNPDDLRELVGRGIIAASQAELIRGSGVDLAAFHPALEPVSRPVVVLPARMLRDKGIAEFVGAARQVHAAGVAAKFLLAGGLDPENPGHVSQGEIARYTQTGDVQWLGHVEDMPTLIRNASIVCLPSYYAEGVPKALLEAAACGKPIVTTDAAGCREVVRQRWNGLLVPPRDADALARALITLLSDATLRAQYGANSRKLAEQEFGVEAVAQRTLAIYRQLLGA